MKRILISLLAAGLTWQIHAESLQWLTDANAAQAQARREGKAVLLDFTGSDWCGWCMRLKSEVFDTPEFAAFAKAHLVLVEVDFPRNKPLSRAQTEANQQLARTFQIEGFPTIILLDRNGNKIGNSGYMPGGPHVFISELAKILRTQPVSPVLPAYTPPVTNYYGSLALKAISGPKEKRLVLINNTTFLAGETASVKIQDRRVVVTCKEIREDSAVVLIDGQTIELKLGGK